MARFLVSVAGASRVGVFSEAESHREHEEDGGWDWRHFVETKSVLGFGVWNFGQNYILYLGLFFFFNLQVQCVNAFLVFTCVYTLDFCIIPLKSMITLLSLLMSSLALIDNEKIASVFPLSMLFLPIKCIHPLPCLSWFLKMHWFQIHLVPKLLKFWIHLGPWPIWFCICCESIFTKYSRPFLLTLSFLPCLKPKHV